MYDPMIGRWHVQDLMAEKHFHYTPYHYTFNNPVLFIDPFGLDTTIYFFDVKEQPVDDYETANYTAEVYIDVDGEIIGPFTGSTYPDSKQDESTTEWNTVDEGEHDFNNTHGHKGRKGLNLVEDNNKSSQENRVSEGSPEDMELVNIHSGWNSRRFSEGCLTISPGDWDSFASNFDWSKGNKGTSKGTVEIYRKNSIKKIAKKGFIKAKKWVQEKL
jgi:hypothetical protein